MYDNPVESLHVLFSLYLEFKSNPVFGQQLAAGSGGGAGGSERLGEGAGYGYGCVRDELGLLGASNAACVRVPVCGCEGTEVGRNESCTCGIYSCGTS